MDTAVAPYRNPRRGVHPALGWAQSLKKYRATRGSVSLRRKKQEVANIGCGPGDAADTEIAAAQGFDAAIVSCCGPGPADADGTEETRWNTPSPVVESVTSPSIGVA